MGTGREPEPHPAAAPGGALPRLCPRGTSADLGDLPAQASCREDQSSGARTCPPPAEPRASVDGLLGPKTTRPPCRRLPAAARPEPLAMSDRMARSHPVQAQLRKEGLRPGRPREHQTRQGKAGRARCDLGTPESRSAGCKPGPGLEAAASRATCPASDTDTHTHTNPGGN